jgi:CubicO group peptidase (beta-lactamase class C family)
MNDERIQAEIQAAINELVTSGAEIGLQVAVIKNGRVVSDAVSGTADPRTGVAVSGDTLFWAAVPGERCCDLGDARLGRAGRA